MARATANNPKPHPLDLERTKYAYIERPNAVAIALLDRHIFSDNRSAKILDVGCGAGATARAVLAAHPEASIHGIEPDVTASELAREGGVSIFNGTFDAWAMTEPRERFDAVLLSDVVEHISDPAQFLRSLLDLEATRDALFVISVPNFAVWYNRIRTAFGRFDYAWSGLYDRTHLRFFTRGSLLAFLRYLGLRAVDVRASPSLVQPIAPLIRKLFFEDKVAAGNHLELGDWKSFQLYSKLVEPIETAVCGLWPELLGFQIVLAARRDGV